MKHKETHQPGGTRTVSGRKDPGVFEGQVCALEQRVTDLSLQIDGLRRELAETKRALRVEQVKYEKSPAALVLLNASGTIVGANCEARNLLGFAERKLVPAPFTALVSRGHIRKFLTHLRDCSAKQTTSCVRLMLRPRGGADRPVRLSANRIRFGPRERWFFQMLITDDGDFSQAEAQLRERDDAVRSFIDSLEGIVWEAEAATGRRTCVSSQAQRLLGYAISEWLDDSDFWRNHIATEDRERVLGTMARAVAEKSNYLCEYRMVAADRSIVWLRESVNVIEENGILKLRGMSLDITESKLREESFEKIRAGLEANVARRTEELAEVVGELEAFSYTLSHDMRAPLRAMHGYADLLRDSAAAALTPEQHGYLKRIQSASERFDELIRDVLKYTRGVENPLELGSKDLDGVLGEVIEGSSRFQAASAEIEIVRPLLPVTGHQALLSQCFTNLLSNAVKFVEPGTRPRIRIRTEPIGAEVRIWVEDNGVGMSTKEQRRLFQMFQGGDTPMRYGGIGIGLEIVQRAVRRMCGRVGAESAPGAGSKFWIQLPRG